MSFSYSFHKSYQVYRFCNKAFSDTTYLSLFYQSYLQINDPSQWGNFVTAIFFNLFFNWVDILYEAITLNNAY